MKDIHITFRVSPDEAAALEDVLSEQTLVNRSQYIKAAINSYSQKVIFR